MTHFELALGTWKLPAQRTDAVRLVQTAFDLGIRAFDTASTYAGGNAEAALAEALRRVPRGAYKLMTKAGLHCGGAQAMHALSSASIRVALASSLRRLGTDYVDTLQVYRPSAHDHVDEIVDALDREVSAGTIRNYSLSDFSGERIQMFLQYAEHARRARPNAQIHRFDALQPAAPPRFGGMELTIYGVLRGGTLVGASAEHDPTAAAFLTAARASSLSAAQLALCWAAERSCANLVIVSSTRIDRIGELSACSDSSVVRRAAEAMPSWTA